MRHSDLDLLIEAAAVQGQLDSGAPLSVVVKRTSLSGRAMSVLARGKNQISQRKMSPRWRPDEDKFLTTCLGSLSEMEIAEALGRSVIAVHLRWKRDLRLPPPTKDPAYLTANQISNGLAVDVKKIMLLIDREILTGFFLPLKRNIRVVKKVTLLRFLTNPMNWVYFDPKRVGRPSRNVHYRGGGKYDLEFWDYARRLVKKRASLWKDEWWRIGKVARYHKVDNRAVNHAVRKGTIPAVDWGNWWILKSVATDPNLHFNRGKGSKGQLKLKIGSGGNAFLVLAKALGLEYFDIGKMMKWNQKRVQYYWSLLKKQKKIAGIIKENGLKVFFDRKNGRVFADWKRYSKRFPGLTRKIKRFKTSSNPSEREYFNKIEKNAKCFRKGEMK